MNKKYLIICLRNEYWNRYDNVVFWGKNSSGYESDLARVGLYTKEEAIKLSDEGDCFISIEKLGITEDVLNFNNPMIEMKVKKTKEVCDYVNKFVKLMQNKSLMKCGA